MTLKSPESSTPYVTREALKYISVGELDMAVRCVLRVSDCTYIEAKRCVDVWAKSIPPDTP